MLTEDQSLNELVEYIRAQKPNQVVGVDFNNNEVVITARPEHIVGLMTFLRDDPQCLFKVLVDICGADYPQRYRRFDVVYNLLSISHNQRVRVKIETDAVTPVNSIQSIFSSAGWYEREAWDMFGIMFADHTDLRRLLTDYGFEGHPLRKDFPLTGFIETRYDDEKKRVVYEPVKLTQEFRRFDFMSPWEGARHVLSGDEKSEG